MGGGGGKHGHDAATEVANTELHLLIYVSYTRKFLANFFHV